MFSDQRTLEMNVEKGKGGSGRDRREDDDEEESVVVRRPASKIRRPVSRIHVTHSHEGPRANKSVHSAPPACDLVCLNRSVPGSQQVVG